MKIKHTNQKADTHKDVFKTTENSRLGANISKGITQLTSLCDAFVVYTFRNETQFVLYNNLNYDKLKKR